MKNLILSLIFITVATCTVSISAQQLNDGSYQWESKQVGLEVTFDVEEDGESIINLSFIHQKDTLRGLGHWVDAPKYSDMEDGGWYEASLEWEEVIYVEIDVQNYAGELKITQNVEGVDVVMLVDRVYKPCMH